MENLGITHAAARRVFGRYYTVNFVILYDGDGIFIGIVIGI